MYSVSFILPLKKVWNFSNYKREQRLKKFEKSKNFENLRILNKNKIFKDIEPRAAWAQKL